MISRVGVWRDRMWPDGWTAVTADGKRSAQFEHTLLVTDLLVLSSWLPHLLLPLIVIAVYYRGRFRQVALHLHCIWVPYLGISSHCSDFSFFNFSLLDNGNFMYNRPCSIAYLFFCWLYCSAGDRNWSRSSYHKVAFIAESVPLAKWIDIDNLFKWGCSTIKIRSYVVPFMTGLEILHEDFWNLGL